MEKLREQARDKYRDLCKEGKNKERERERERARERERENTVKTDTSLCLKKGNKD